MYICICAQVRECELRDVITAGARNVDDIAQACGAGTGCGSCTRRVQAVLGKLALPELKSLCPAELR
ncbi:MAG: (2Fe-2S)-binding protein [Acidimicrobiales bacterium]|nr:MAG: (2Fe-2S)-binding protein [Acidimicrobiales bacterium]